MHLTYFLSVIVLSVIVAARIELLGSQNQANRRAASGTSPDIRFIVCKARAMTYSEPATVRRAPSGSIGDTLLRWPSVGAGTIRNAARAVPSKIPCSTNLSLA